MILLFLVPGFLLAVPMARVLLTTTKASNTTERACVLVCWSMIGTLSILAPGFAFWILDAFQAGPLSISLSESASFILLVIAAGVAAVRCSSRATFLSVDIAVLVIWVMLICAYQALYVPAFGWDVLDHWAHHADRFILHYQSEAVGVFPFTHRHPPTLNFVLAWPVLLGSSGASTVPSPLMLWVLFYLYLVICVHGVALAKIGNKYTATLITIVVTSAPLLENHILIAGYAEAVVTLLLLLAVAFAIFSFDFRSGYFLSVSVGISLLIIFVKNTGLYYSFLFLISLLGSYGLTANRKLAVLLVGVLVASAGYALLNGFYIDFHHKSLGYDAINQIVYFAGREMAWSAMDALSLEALRSLCVTFFVNQSFSIIPISLLFLFIFAWIKDNNACHNPGVLPFFFCFGVLFISTLLMAFGFDYVAGNSSTGRDTLLSRTVMPIMVSLSLLFPAYIGGLALRPSMSKGRCADGAAGF